MADSAASASGDKPDFARLVGTHRRELLVHAYRILGSSQDAEDAVQEALTAAWRGLDELRSPASIRPWLYRITTNASLRLAERRPPKMLSWERSPAATPGAELGEFLDLDSWIEPLRATWTDSDPESAALRQEHIELAWVAAVQRLPATQRAVLVLRDVLTFSAAETAEILGTTTTSVTSALQRARATLADHDTSPKRAQRRGLDESTLTAFVDAFIAGDVDGVVRLLAKDARFTMPPLLAWFEGRSDIGVFLAERVFATPWRVRHAGVANGRQALMADQLWDGTWRPGAVIIPHGCGDEISWLATFITPTLLATWTNDFPPDR